MELDSIRDCVDISGVASGDVDTTDDESNTDGVGVTGLSEDDKDMIVVMLSKEFDVCEGSTDETGSVDTITENDEGFDTKVELSTSEEIKMMNDVVDDDRGTGVEREGDNERGDDLKGVGVNDLIEVGIDGGTLVENVMIVAVDISNDDVIAIIGEDVKLGLDVSASIETVVEVDRTGVEVNAPVETGTEVDRTGVEVNAPVETGTEVDRTGVEVNAPVETGTEVEITSERCFRAI